MPTHRKLALYSDQESSGNKEMDTRLLQLIGRPQPRIGYLPAEPDPGRIAFQRQADYYAGIGANLAVTTTPERDISAAAWSALLSCDAIHLSGGNTFSFLAWLQQCNALPRLTQYVSEGGVLIGVSAGAILMTPRVDSARLCGDVQNDPALDTTALGLVGFHFWPHYPGERLTSAQSSFASTIPDLYACPDGSGIIIDGDEVTLYGEVRRN